MNDTQALKYKYPGFKSYRNDYIILQNTIYYQLFVTPKMF